MCIMVHYAGVVKKKVIDPFTRMHRDIYNDALVIYVCRMFFKACARNPNVAFCTSSENVRFHDLSNGIIRLTNEGR